MFCNLNNIYVSWSAQQTYVQHAESKQIILLHKARPTLCCDVFLTGEVS